MPAARVMSVKRTPGAWTPWAAWRRRAGPISGKWAFSSEWSVRRYKKTPRATARSGTVTSRASRIALGEVNILLGGSGHCSGCLRGPLAVPAGQERLHDHVLESPEEDPHHPAV